MANRGGYGLAPHDTTCCPRCDRLVSKDGQIITPRPSALQRYGSWCKALKCRLCTAEWYICTKCSTTHVPIDTPRKLIRHTSTFHRSAKRASKRPSGDTHPNEVEAKRHRGDESNKKTNNPEKISKAVSYTHLTLPTICSV